MPDTPSPAPSSPASLDVAAAHDALTWAIARFEKDSERNAGLDSDLARHGNARRAGWITSLVALREALPDVNADSMRSLRALVSAVEQAAQIDAKEEIDDNGHAWARVSALVSALGFRFQQAERRASEAKARATRAEDALAIANANCIERDRECFDLRQRLASTERALAEARDDAERWRFARRYFSVDSDGDGEFLFMHDDRPSADAYVHRGFGNTVDSIIDASIAREAAAASSAPTTPTTETT
jgi:hypothetical protein